jgi:membrane protein implicated in regulation of membrane protease activity
MKPFAFLFHWYNLPFTMALATGIVLALLQLFGGFGDNDAEVEAAPAADLAVDGDLEADAPAGSGGSLAAHGGPLAALGVGRVPLVLIIMALLSSLGALGLFANSLLSALAAPYPGLAFVPVFLLAAIGALPLTRVISGGLARMAPRTSTAVNNEDLIGRAGVVVSAGVSQTYGRVAVRDRHGTLHTVFAVIERGEPLPVDSEVALLSYDAAQRRFTVRALR